MSIPVHFHTVVFTKRLILLYPVFVIGCYGIALKEPIMDAKAVRMVKKVRTCTPACHARLLLRLCRRDSQSL